MEFKKNIASLLALVGLFIFTSVVFFQLQVAFGWGNPTGAPPAGNGALGALAGNVEINTVATTDSNAPALKITPNLPTQVEALDVMGGRITGVAAPVNGTDAVNKDWLLASGGGGGSLAIYYRTISNLPAPPPSCPSGWTALPFTGYGPHYLGLFAHDWLQNGTGGTGGGFAAGFTPPAIPGTPGASYILRSVAIGSDSVCSQDQQSVVYFSNLYNNQLSSGFTSMKADACFTDSVSGVTECNRCIVCQK